jgi:hypothetical protein
MFSLPQLCRFTSSLLLLLHCPTVVSPERILVNLENILADLRSQRARMDQAISALEGSTSPSAPRRGRPPKSQTASARRQRRRTMSAAARKRISNAMKQRWAKWKGKSAPKKAKSRRPMSAAARKKLSALMKARWAARKKEKA